MISDSILQTEADMVGGGGCEVQVHDTTLKCGVENTEDGHSAEDGWLQYVTCMDAYRRL